MFYLQKVCNIFLGCIKSEKEIKHAVVVVMKTICDIKCWFVRK